MEQPLSAPDPSIPPVPSSSPPPIPPPAHTSYVPKLLVVAVLFLTLGLGAGFTLSNYVSAPKPAPAPMAPISPSPTPDPTANWKTYMSSQYGFSLKHPGLDETCCMLAGAFSDSPVHIVTLADKSTVRPNSDAPFDGLAVYVIPNKNKLTLDQYLEEEKAALFGQFKAMADPNQVHRGQISETVVAGQSAKVLTNYSWDGITRTYFKHPNGIIIEISKKEQSDMHFVLYDQILSTFKFTD